MKIRPGKILSFATVFILVLSMFITSAYAGVVGGDPPPPPPPPPDTGGGYVPPVNTTGVIAEYHFNGDFKEANNSGMDGVANGSVTFTDGVDGQCAVFSGGFLDVTNGTGLNPGVPFSVSVWLKPDFGAAGVNPVVFKQLPPTMESTEGTFGVYANGTAGLTFTQNAVEDNTAKPSTLETSGLALDYAWTHVVFVCDGSSQYIYVNGVLNTSQKLDDAVKSGSFISSGKVVIGGDASGNVFKGKIDELKIYNKALTPGDITTQSGAYLGAYKHSLIFRIGSPTMMKDGVAMPIDPNNNKVMPFSDKPSGRTMVPIRAIVENMGGQIAFVDAVRQVDITLNAIVIQLWLDNMMAKVNEEDIPLDAAAVGVEGRTMVPLRFVAENLGADVGWENESKTVTILF